MKKYFNTIFFALFILIIPAVVFGLTGDANMDGSVNIIDALVTAQYYVGLDPPNFDIVAADSNCDDTVNIVDALIIAQYYVDLISAFEGCGEPTIEPTPEITSIPTPTEGPTGTETPEPTNVPYFDSRALPAVHPTEMFSHTFSWANKFDSWSITSLPSWLSTPKTDNGAYDEPVTFRVDWSQFYIGQSLSWNVVFTIQGEPTGKTEYILGVSATNLDPNPTPTPVVTGPPAPTVPAMITFQGYVYDADTYTPVEGAEITLTVEGQTILRTSDANGHYGIQASAGFRVPAELTISGSSFPTQSYSFPDILGSYNHDFPVESYTASSETSVDSHLYEEVAFLGHHIITVVFINKPSRLLL